MENKFEFPENKTEKIFEEIKKTQNALTKIEDFDRLIEAQDKIADFIGSLRKKYPQDYIDYALYHVACGSTPRIPWPEFKKIDFPGEGDSIKSFFEELKKEYL